MIIRVPITGELIDYDPNDASRASGNPNNAVRPLDFRKLLPAELFDFAWTALEYDYKNSIVTIEVEFAKKTLVTQQDTDGTPLAWREESDAEFIKRRTDTEKALANIFNEKTIDELYQMTGEPKLKKPKVALAPG